MHVIGFTASKKMSFMDGDICTTALAVLTAWHSRAELKILFIQKLEIPENWKEQLEKYGGWETFHIVALIHAAASENECEGATDELHCNSGSAVT